MPMAARFACMVLRSLPATVTWSMVRFWEINIDKTACAITLIIGPFQLASLGLVSHSGPSRRSLWGSMAARIRLLGGECETNPRDLQNVRKTEHNVRFPVCFHQDSAGADCLGYPSLISQ